VTSTRDYRGTIDSKLPIRMHIVRAGSSLRGAYVYEKSSGTIDLAGQVGDDGTFTMTENVHGAPTGTFHLQANKDDLNGTWTDSKETKTLAVRLSGSKAPLFAVNDAGKVGRPAKEGDDCLADLPCSAETAAADFARADVERDPDLDCSRFVDGSGVPLDARRGRACLEREVTSCDGRSDMNAFALAAMRIDGVGGPRDLAAADKELASCGDDLADTLIVKHENAVKRDPKTEAMASCMEFAGTTLMMSACAMRGREVSQTKMQLASKAIYRTLDDAGKKLFAAVDAKYAAYVDSRGDFVYEALDGTIRQVLVPEQESSAFATRAEELSKFAAFAANDVTAADVLAAKKKTASAVDAIKPESPAAKTALAKTQSAWGKYEEAEIALYVHTFGAKQGDDKVKNAITLRLETRQAKECAPPSLGGN
jgi:uncharacterized protein YecT (DUF1311 family)